MENRAATGASLEQEALGCPKSHSITGYGGMKVWERQRGALRAIGAPMELGGAGDRPCGFAVARAESPVCSCGEGSAALWGSRRAGGEE